MPDKSDSEVVEYVPPPDRVIERFARDLCQQLGFNEPGANDSQVNRGLADFLKFLAKMHAKRLNQRKDQSPAA